MSRRPAVGQNDAVSSVRESEPSPPGPAYASSLLALALGVGLAVGVSWVFGLLGWGGELASQAAGALSGAAPLIVDGIRQRRSRVRPRPGLRALARGALRRYNRVWVASAFGFAVLLVDSAAGLGVWRLSGLLVPFGTVTPSPLAESCGRGRPD